MTTPLYKSTIGAFIRQAESLAAIMAQGREHLGADADAFVNERLTEDMLPFSFQIRSVAHHGNVAEALRTGKSGPPPAMEVEDYATLENLVTETLDKLHTVTAEELDSLLDKDVIFALGETKIPFTGLGYLTSFSLPNFYFHVTTAYNLLRQKGVPLGKRDYLGAMDLNFG
ncbi:MAG: DUF1993 domain-containing protein [Henriciella sp.]|nr:DUF1993 domain-containing protein [Henriciella sp.]